jgi:hypothetical protein
MVAVETLRGPGVLYADHYEGTWVVVRGEERSEALDFYSPCCTCCLPALVPQLGPFLALPEGTAVAVEENGTVHLHLPTDANGTRAVTIPLMMAQP